MTLLRLRVVWTIGSMSMDLRQDDVLDPLDTGHPSGQQAGVAGHEIGEVFRGQYIDILAKEISQKRKKLNILSPELDRKLKGTISNT